MDKNYLLETAKQLPIVSENTHREYCSKSEELIVKMNQLMTEREDILSLVGEKNINMMKDNHANHARFIASILKNFNPHVLVDTVLWVFRSYRSHGFTSNYWAAQLNNWIALFEKNLSPEAYEEVLPYYKWMQINIPTFSDISDKALQTPNSEH
jgi:hypothetical protein